MEARSNNSLSWDTVFLVLFKWARQPSVTPGLVHVELRSKIMTWNPFPWDLKLLLPAVKPYIFIAFSHGPFKLQFLLTDLALSSSSFPTAEDFHFLILNLARYLHFYILLTLLCVKGKGQEAVSHKLCQSNPSHLSKHKYDHIASNGYPFTWRTNQFLYLVILKTPHPGGILAFKLYLQSYP